MQKKRCIIVDACEFSGNYNNCLLDAMGKQHSEIYYATTVSPYADYPHPDNVKVINCFFFLARAAAKFTSSNLVRKFLRGLEYPFDLCVLLLIVLIKRIKVVHIMWSVLPDIDFLYMKLLKLMGRKVILTAHNPFPHEFETKHVAKYARLYEEVDFLITLTEHSRKEILSHADVSEDKIAVIPHGDFGYVLSHFEVNEPLAAKVKSLAGSRSIVSYFGQIRPYKGVEFFIKAIPLIKSINPSLFFVIAGNPRFDSRAQLESLVAENCDPADVYCDFRFVPTADMKTYFKITDVLVQPYISASQSGNTVMAYSFGIPVISTDVGGLGEMTKNGVTGYVVPPSDSEAIAHAILDCFTDDNYKKLSDSCLKCASNEYSWDKIASEHICSYQKLFA